MRRTLYIWIGACVALLAVLGVLLGALLLNSPDVPETEPIQTTDTTPPPPTTILPPETTAEPTTEATLPAPEFEIAATHAFVYDSTKGNVLFTKGDPTQRISIASVTKLFTSFVALQYLQPDVVITAGEEVTWIDPDSSIAYILPDHQLTADMCVQGLLMPSGNDAAYMLAVAAGRAIQNNPDLSAQAALGIFINEMNNQAQTLGMANSHFANPDGIDAAGHYSCLEDLIILSRQALQTQNIKAYASMAKADVVYESGETNTWYNSNALLHEQSPYYCEAACGLKTGSTDEAGKCLVSAFKTEEGELLVGVFGCPEDADRYRDTLQLYSHYTGVPVELPVETVPEDNTVETTQAAE